MNLLMILKCISVYVKLYRFSDIKPNQVIYVESSTTHVYTKYIVETLFNNKSCISRRLRIALSTMKAGYYICLLFDILLLTVSL